MTRSRLPCSRRGLLLVLSLVFSAPAAGGALQTARVLRPAVYERAGETVNLLPQLGLQAGDRVRTGFDGRVRLVAADGTALTLASASTVDLGRMPQAAGEGLEATLVSGALGVESQASPVSVTAGELQVQGRGASWWIERGSGASSVCLRAGALLVHGPQGARALARRGDCLRLAGDGELQAFSAEEAWEAMLARVVFPESGATLPPSGWTLVVASIADHASAVAEAEGLRGEGLQVQLLPAGEGRERTYRVGIGGFATRGEAEAFIPVLRQRHGIAGAWPTPY